LDLPWALPWHYWSQRRGGASEIQPDEGDAVISEDDSWQRLLRDALVMLALPADDQVRTNGPGCLACDLSEAFYSAYGFALESAPILSDNQRDVLAKINAKLRAMQGADVECGTPKLYDVPLGPKCASWLLRLCGRSAGWERGANHSWKSSGEYGTGLWRRTNRTLDGSFVGFCGSLVKRGY
jgi:hypothetical protein